jgi:hypothetical protein
MQPRKNSRHAFAINESRQGCLDEVTEALTHRAYSHLKLAACNFQANTPGRISVVGLTKKSPLYTNKARYFTANSIGYVTDETFTPRGPRNPEL